MMAPLYILDPASDAEKGMPSTSRPSLFPSCPLLRALEIVWLLLLGTDLGC